LRNEITNFSEVKCGFESKAEDAEIVYFSVLSDLTGKGFGKFLIKSILSKLAEKGISKVFLNTCTFDHMYALDFYKRFNFKIYERKHKKIDIEMIGKDIFENSQFYKRSF
jgi:GNAT superfamily N-acetyltransferase